MTMGVFDFKAIAKRLNCQEQKVEFEDKNPKVEPNKVVWSPEWGYGTAAPLTSMAHPEWPYTGTPHAWPKVKV